MEKVETVSAVKHLQSTSDTGTDETNKGSNQMEKFTEMEKKVLKAHFKVASEGNGTSIMEDLINDNYSYADVKDLSKKTGYTINQVKGVVSSLCKKNAIYPEGEDDYDLLIIDPDFMKEFDPKTNFLSDDFLK